MIAAALVNFGLCFKSLDWLAFRTWEAAAIVEHPSGIGPFEPGSIILKEHAYGDLAGLGNMKDMREYRRGGVRGGPFSFRNFLAEQTANQGSVFVFDCVTFRACGLNS